MVSREEVGSWIEGTPGGTTNRGARLGLPADGSGSLATLGRRVGGLFLDWIPCMLVAWLFTRHEAGVTFPWDAPTLVTLTVCAVENVLLVGTVGYTFGQWAVGLRVRRMVPNAPDGLPGPLRGLVRSVLLFLVIPAVVWDADGRGLHDRIAGTAIVRR